MKRSVTDLMNHLEETGALVWEHSDSPRDIHTRRQLEVEIESDPDFETLSSTSYQIIARKRRNPC